MLVTNHAGFVAFAISSNCLAELRFTMLSVSVYTRVLAMRLPILLRESRVSAVHRSILRKDWDQAVRG